MAKYTKGNGGAGRKPGKTDPDVLESRRITKDMVMDIFGSYLSMDLKSLKERMEDESKPVAHHIIGRIALKAIETGQHGAMDSILNRVIGPVVDKLEVTHVEPIVIEFADGKALSLEMKQVD